MKGVGEKREFPRVDMESQSLEFFYICLKSWLGLALSGVGGGPSLGVKFYQ